MVMYCKGPGSPEILLLVPVKQRNQPTIKPSNKALAVAGKCLHTVALVHCQGSPRLCALRYQQHSSAVPMQRHDTAVQGTWPCAAAGTVSCHDGGSCHTLVLLLAPHLPTSMCRNKVA
eukprot:GHUV01033938.1.p1 GENE.GHUV01033938.1~~GHUV01033938.1.p1  ORF type:complete len:118 (+),score=23.47 GHUV01033938.1:135-488(+)